MRLDVKEVGAENTVDFDYTNEGYVKKVVDKTVLQAMNMTIFTDL